MYTEFYGEASNIGHFSDREGESVVLMCLKKAHFEDWQCVKLTQDYVQWQVLV